MLYLPLSGCPYCLKELFCNFTDQLCAIKELTGPKLYRRLGELGVDSLGELQCHIKAVQSTIEDLKRKLVFKDEFNKGILTKDWLQEKVTGSNFMIQL